MCYVTDRKALSAAPETALHLLLEKIEATGRAGVHWIQIREKDLSARELAELMQEAKRRVPASCRILVNDRLDVALAMGAGGVHLAERSLPVGQARRLLREKPRAAPGEFFVGASTHSLEAAKTAEKDGADYAFFGPVFSTPSKEVYGPPQGIEQLQIVCRHVSLPVIAIGGITLRNVAECIAAGARGVAAIRLFQEAKDIAAVATELRGA